MSLRTDEQVIEETGPFYIGPSERSCESPVTGRGEIGQEKGRNFCTGRQALGMLGGLLTHGSHAV